MTENKVRVKKIWKWTGGIFLVISILIAAVLFYLSQHWKPALTREIKQVVINSTDSLYSIDFADISVNLLTGNVSVKNIVFKPDSAVYKKLEEKFKAPKHLFEIEVAGLILNRVHPWKIYFGRKLQMKSVIINKPELRVVYERNSRTDSLEKDTRTAYQRLSKYLKSVKIEKIIFSDADFKYIDKSYKTPKIDGIKNLDISISDLLIDSLSQYDKSRFYYTKDIFVQAKDHTIHTADSMYIIKFKDFTASSGKGYARLESLQVIPRYPEMEFSRKYTYQKDRYAITFNEIILRDIDFHLLNLQRKLRASIMEINNSSVNVFLNRQLPKPPIDKGRNYPHVALKRLDLNTKIDTIKLKNAVIHYTEYNPKTSQKGTVVFENLGGTLLNVTNDSLSLVKNNHCKAELYAKLMGAGDLNVNIDFNLTSPDAAFSYSGTIGKMSMRLFNRLSKALALIEIKSGQIDKASFSVDADYRRSKGILKLYYSNFRVGILKQDENDEIKKQGLISLFANVLVIKNNNPAPNGEFRTGHISYVRPDQASFFNLMWKSIFTSAKESVGYTDKVEAKLKKQLKKKEKKEEKKKD